MGNHIEKLNIEDILDNFSISEIGPWSEENCKKYGMKCEKLKIIVSLVMKLRKRIVKELSALHTIDESTVIPEDCPDNYCTDISRIEVVDLTKRGLKIDPLLDLDFLLFTDIERIQFIQQLLQIYSEIVIEEDGKTKFRDVSGVRIKEIRKIIAS
jgi:hypothetical protein